MTPIDQLIVTLGLDTRPLIAGARQAIKIFNQTSAQIQKQTQGISASSNTAAAGMNALRLGVAGLAAIVGVVGTRELIEWNKQMTEAGSKTYRFANRIGSTVPVVNQLRGAVRIAGGTFEDADAGLTGITDALQKWQLLGVATPAPFLRQFGVDLAAFDPNKAEDMIRLVNTLAKGATNLKPGQVNALLGGIFPPGFIDLILQGPAKVKEILATAEKYARNSEEAAKNARKLDETLGTTALISKAIGEYIYNWFSPYNLRAAEKFKSIMEEIAEYMGVTGGKGFWSNLGESLANGAYNLGNLFLPIDRIKRYLFGGGASESPGAHGRWGVSNSRWRSGLNVGQGYSVGRPDIVSSATGLPVKAGEFNSGGNVNATTVALAGDIYRAMSGDISQFTGFNDRFHQGMGSRHETGEAFDFTLKDPSRAAEVIRQIHAMAPKARVLNEYTNPSPGSNGGHIHVTINVNGYSAKDANIMADTTAKRLQDALGSANGSN